MQTDFLVPAGLDRLGNGFNNAFSDEGGTFGLGKVGGDDGEHVAREPSTAVFFAHSGAQAARYGPQCFITDIGTKPVIDGAEIVDIDHQYGQQLFIAFCMRNRLIKPVIKQRMIGKPG